MSKRYEVTGYSDPKPVAEANFGVEGQEVRRSMSYSHGRYAAEIVIDYGFVFQKVANIGCMRSTQST